MAERRTIVYRDEVYQLPFADLFRPLTPDEAKGLEASVRVHGVIEPVVLFESTCWGVRCVLDGANRLTVAASLDAEVPFVDKGPMGEKEARQLAVSLNADRRHLTLDEQIAARAERVERVKKARKSGDSIRAIAEKEGVSKAQVERDLADPGGSGVPPGTPGDEIPAKVKGKDGKEYAAKKPVAKPEPSPPSSAQHSDSSGVAESQDSTGERSDAGDGEPEAVVSHAGAAKAIGVIKSALRHHQRAQEEISGLLTGPFSQQLRNLAESYTGCKFYDTGETIQQTFHGGTSVGIPRYSNDATDAMLGFFGGAKQMLARIEAAPAGGDESEAPWEKADFDAVLRSDDDVIPI